MRRVFLALFSLLLAAVPVAAQNANQAQLRLVVIDETGAGIPAATIVVTPVNRAPVTLMADERGLATVSALPAGAVQLHVEFSGFSTIDQNITLRRGANNQTVTMKIAGVEEQVVVSDTTGSLDDRNGNSLTTTLEENEISELPDDPDELQAVLEQMAGGAGAVFQVNGFRGGRLPSRDEIRQIRFRTNSFAADNHDAGRVYVEIITRPNVREWSGNANVGLRSDVLNARNSFASTKQPESINRFNTGLRGPLVTGKTAIRFNIDGNRSTESDTIFALDENGQRIGNEFRRPSDRTNIMVGVEHALTKSQTLRLEFRNGVNNSHNLGVGGFNLLDRAFERTSTDHQFRAQIQGLVGKTTLNELRFQYRSQDTESSSLSTAPSIIVLDAFSRGGAGVSSHGSTASFELADNVDFNVGRKHAMRAGFLLEGGDYANFDARNAYGTFTFSSLDAFVAGRPTQYTLRQGQVETNFNNYDVGIYWQDDVRVNKSFSYSLGLRQEMQSHIGDKLNPMPRLGFTWNPFGSRTAVRGGYGMFYDWYDTNLYDQTLRVNGIAQKDLLILFPGYPDPFAGSTAVVLPGGRVQSASNLQLPFEHQASIGVERPITQNLTLQASYMTLRGRNQLRSRNVNAPDASGVRPEPHVGNVTEIDSTGRSHTDRLNVNASYRVPAKRMFINANYTLGSIKNHADNPLQLPANSLNPDAEWAPSSQDVRHRFNAMINFPIAGGFRMNAQANAQSALPFTITTGRDDNQDGVVNDRPAGVGRNSERGSARFDMSMRLSKSVGFGGVRQNGQGGGQGGGRGQGGRTQGQGQGRGGGQGQGAAQGGGQFPAQFAGGPPPQGGLPQGAPAQGGPGGGAGGPGGPGGGGGGGFFGDGANQRFSVEFYAQGNNIFNRTNFLNYSGVTTSTLFLQPTAAAQARRIEVGMQFRF
jgi:hypothetical protein